MKEAGLIDLTQAQMVPLIGETSKGLDGRSLNVRMFPQFCQALRHIRMRRGRAEKSQIFSDTRSWSMMFSTLTGLRESRGMKLRPLMRI
jgi:hypothetical protein